MSANEGETMPEAAVETNATDTETEAVPESAGAPAAAAGGERPALGVVIDVPLKLTVEIGTASMLVKDVLQLGRGSVIPLDRMSGDPADILVNGRLIARGEVTIVDDRLAVRVTQLMSGAAEDAR